MRTKIEIKSRVKYFLVQIEHDDKNCMCSHRVGGRELTNIQLLNILGGLATLQSAKSNVSCEALWSRMFRKKNCQSIHVLMIVLTNSYLNDVRNVNTKASLHKSLLRQAMILCTQ